jgi:murein DD-endopeptidase MepM/ murein hydrolase activator NlpD
VKKLLKYIAIVVVGFGVCLNAYATWIDKYNDEISAWLSGGAWTYYTVHKGDSVEKVFNKLLINKQDQVKLLKIPSVKNFLINLKPKQQISVLLKKKKVLSLYTKKSGKILVINRKKDSFITKIEAQKIVKTIRHTSITIDSNLYNAAKKYNIPKSLILEVDKALSSKVDFAKQLRKGDKLAMTYEYSHSQNFDEYKLLDAKYCQHKKCFRAIYYNKGEMKFYDEIGNSLETAFDRYPLKHFRISSTFARHRWHPVLHTWRSHLGVDLAAPFGSKILATGDGKVVFSGMRGGYGRAVVIKHGKKYKTVYAHMSKIANKSWVGNLVKKGDVIGYVGKTGLATGFHCHYEFRVNNKAVNPLTIKLPKYTKITKADKASFAKRKAELDHWMTI